MYPGWGIPHLGRLVQTFLRVHEQSGKPGYIGRSDLPSELRIPRSRFKHLDEECHARTQDLAKFSFFLPQRTARGRGVHQ
jgi:hypothetical protein